MGTPIDDSPFVCMDCARRQPDSGDCRACGNGPVLDSRDRDVRQTLHDDDDKRARKREGAIVGVSVLLGVGGWFGAAFVSDFAARIVVANCVMGLLVCGGTTVVLWLALRKLFAASRRFSF